MKSGAVSVVAVLFLVGAAYCGREVVFIGLSGEGAPAIEKNFNRLFFENISVIPGVFTARGDELARLQARVNSFSYPTVSSPLLESLGRFASDTALVVWGMVKECSIRPARRWLFGAAIRGDLDVELVIYNIASRGYVFIGDVKATALLWKGFAFLRPVETVVHVTAADRAEISNKMQSGAVSKGGRVIESVLLSETSRKAKTAPLPAEAKKEDAETAINPMSADTTAPGDERAMQPDSANVPRRAKDETADTTAADSTGKPGSPDGGRPQDSE